MRKFETGFLVGSSDKPKTEVYQKKKVGDDQNNLVAIASKISGNNLDWIATLEAENGLWDLRRKHPNQNKNGTWDYSCGLNSAYHKPFINQLKVKSDTEILQYCYDVYNGRKTAFYGYFQRQKHFDKFYLTLEKS